MMNRLRFMNSLVISLVLVGGLAAGGQSFADPGAQTGMQRRQAVKECMSRQMAANKSMSYIDATKACTERLRSQSDDSAASTQIKQ
jgi:hypothetical protein